ncbi:hypothetical protein RB195_007068 [Necator americanus]|uniref:Reverse transcriptase domain-containing protein n=1 Tax=Necator americanus TaxID=51031 RepID=A0ABR1BYM9_NECAM
MCPENQVLTDSVRKLFLEEINQIRSQVAQGRFFTTSNRKARKASKMIKLTYNCEAETSAINWAEECEDRDSGTPDYAETRKTPDFFHILVKAINGWKNEPNIGRLPPEGTKPQYIYRTTLGIPNFAKMVWDTEREVGCSIANCYSFMNVVCHFTPRGGVVGSPMYKVGPTCNRCVDIGLPFCSDGLCSAGRLREALMSSAAISAHTTRLILTLEAFQLMHVLYHQHRYTTSLDEDYQLLLVPPQIGTCDSRGVGGVGVLVNTSMAKNIDSFEQLTTRIGCLRMRRCGPIPAIFVAYAPTSSYEEKEVEVFYMDLEKFYQEDHAFYKVIIGDFNAKDYHQLGSLRYASRLLEDSAMDNIDEEYDRLVEHLHDCAKKAESFKTTKRRLSLQTLELIRQRGAARAAGNQELTSEFARLCREAIREDLKERRAEVLAEAAEAGRSIRYARREFASRKTRMTALRNPKGTTIASRRGMEKIIYDSYSDLFDSHVHLPPHHLREDGQVIPEVLPSKIRHAIMSVRNRTAPGPDRIRPEHLKSLPPVLINTLTRLFTRYLSECKVPKRWKTSKTVLLYKKGDPHDIGNYRPICLLSVIYKLLTRVILNRIEKVLDEGQPCEQAGFRKGFSTIDHIHTVSKLIEVSREYKMPLCLTFIDLKKAFDSVETEAVVEALDNQGVPTQYIKVLHKGELYSNFTTGISPFYKNIIIKMKKRVRQGDTIPPKILKATLENAMRKLEWNDMGVKVDGRQLHHLRFADDILLVTPSISHAERMLTEFDETCGCIGLQLNLQKTMFMRNGWVSDAPFTAQRNEHIRMHQLRLSGSGTEHDERPDPRAGQKETSGLGSVQKHRGCSEEDQEHPAPCSPLQHHRTSCFDICFGNLGISQAGRKLGERH